MEYFASQTARLTLSWLNGKTANSIFSNQGGYANTLTLVVGNGTAAAVTIPVPSATDPLPSPCPGIAIDFGALVAPGNLAGIACSTAGWATAVATGMLIVHPTQAASVAANGQLTLTLTNIVVGAMAGQDIVVSMDLYGDKAAGLAKLLNPSFYVSVLDPPPPASSPLDIAVGFQPNRVAVQSSEPGTLRLFMVNQSDTALSWTGSKPPQFRMTFVTGSGPGALCSATGLSSIAVVQTAGAAGWSIGNPTASQPGWTLTPPAAAKTLLGVGSQAAAAFDVGGIAPKTVGVTEVQVSYTGMTGFADDCLTLPVLKMPVAPEPQIVSFTASRQTVDLTSGDLSVELSYQVANAVRIFIHGAQVCQSVEIGNSGTGSGTVTVTPQQTSPYMLVAQSADGRFVSQGLTVTVTPCLYDTLPVNTVMLWSGATPPAGWVLCNGQNSTPNLVDKFVPGAGNLYTPGMNAPADQHTHAPLRVTGTTSPVPNIRHGFGHISFHFHGSLESNPLLPVGNHVHQVPSTAFTTGSANVTPPANTVAGPAGGVRPSWYALAYIVKQY